MIDPAIVTPIGVAAFALIIVREGVQLVRELVQKRNGNGGCAKCNELCMRLMILEERLRKVEEHYAG